MTTIITISIAVAAAAVAASAAYLLCALRKNSLEKELAGKDAEIGPLKPESKCRTRRTAA